MKKQLMELKINNIFNPPLPLSVKNNDLTLLKKFSTNMFLIISVFLEDNANIYNYNVKFYYKDFLNL